MTPSALALTASHAVSIATARPGVVVLLETAIPPVTVEFSPGLEIYIVVADGFTETMFEPAEAVDSVATALAAAQEDARAFFAEMLSSVHA